MRGVRQPARRGDQLGHRRALGTLQEGDHPIAFEAGRRGRSGRDSRSGHGGRSGSRHSRCRRSDLLRCSRRGGSRGIVGHWLHVGRLGRARDDRRLRRDVRFGLRLRCEPAGLQNPEGEPPALALAPHRRICLRPDLLDEALLAEARDQFGGRGGPKVGRSGREIIIAVVGGGEDSELGGR